jgi:hypothetical protein
MTNIVNVASIYGRIAHIADVSNSGSTVDLNPADVGGAGTTVPAGDVAKLNAVYVSNTSSGDLTATVTIVDASSNTFDLINTITVPANATLDVISKSMYLPAGYGMTITASAATGIDALVSWEELSE